MRIAWISISLMVNTSLLWSGPPTKQSDTLPDSLLLSSRVALSAGMGVEYFSAPDIVDFVNGLVVGQGVQRLPEFKSAVQFFGVVSYPLSRDWVLKGEYAYLLASYNLDVPSDITLTIHMPSAIVQYVLWDKGLYNIKIGAGLGYHVGTLKVKYLNYGDNLTAKGLGAVADVEAATAFGDHLFAYLGCDARFEFIGTMKSSFVAPQNSLPTLQAFSVGARLGFSYYF